MTQGISRFTNISALQDHTGNDMRLTEYRLVKNDQGNPVSQVIALPDFTSIGSPLLHPGVLSCNSNVLSKDALREGDVDERRRDNDL